MSYTEFKRLILFHYHANIRYWYELVGEFFEGTQGFSKPYFKNCTLQGRKVTISWDNYAWLID